MTARVERVVTSGVVTLGDTEQKIENNTWIVGDDAEVIVIDPARDGAKILREVGDREVLAVVCTHGYPDHTGAARAVAERDDAPVAVHPKEKLAWRETYPDTDPDIDVEGGGVFAVGGIELAVIHTPGASPGGICLYGESLGAVFSGDTLLRGGPKPIGEGPVDLPRQLTSIGEHLLSLPPDTRVLPAHGDETTVGEEEPHFDDWVASGPISDQDRE